MTTEALIPLFERDLDNLIKEINNYDREEDLWIKEGTISNSAGNLCLHIVGNLNHFIGKTLGGTNYIRDRESEFTLRDVPIAEMIEMIRSAKNVVLIVLRNLTDDALRKTYPIEVFGYKMTTEYFLVHLFGHLNYHLGQINYHRRLLIVENK
jgi:uncharacterized damage-inducible protein DinB